MNKIKNVRQSIIVGSYSEWVLIPMMGLFLVKCHYKWEIKARMHLVLWISK